MFPFKCCVGCILFITVPLSQSSHWSQAHTPAWFLHFRGITYSPRNSIAFPALLRITFILLYVHQSLTADYFHLFHLYDALFTFQHLIICQHSNIYVAFSEYFVQIIYESSTRIQIKAATSIRLPFNLVMLNDYWLRIVTVLLFLKVISICLTLMRTEFITRRDWQLVALTMYAN